MRQMHWITLDLNNNRTVMVSVIPVITQHYSVETYIRAMTIIMELNKKCLKKII